jgi:hypothetical protein
MPPGISEQQAIAVAREQLPPGAVLTRTLAGPYAMVAGAMIRTPTEHPPADLPGATWVWGVEFSREINICESPDHCEDRRASSTVILKYNTGEFVSTSTFAENPNPE